MKVIEDMPEMAQYVYDFYQTKLKTWQKSRNQQEKVDKEERLRKLNEEEKVLREKLNETIEKSENKFASNRLNIGKNYEVYSSSSSEDEEENESNHNGNENNMSQDNQIQQEEIQTENLEQ